ncbi:cellulose synthase-like protein E2 [Ziziphus jujuba]|nr:cellulose synthase-like protein E2 [Ziziphus jujuba]
MDVGLSKFCPFIYDPSKMLFLGKMCYAELSFFPLYCLPLWCFATVPQLCLLNGTSIYPEVSNPYFIIFPFIFMSSSIKLLYEIFITGGSYRSWINEQRIWMIKSITSHLYGCLDAFMKRIGMRKTSFLATNKVDDDEQVMLYKKGLIDFRTSAMFLAPLITLMMLNMVSLVVGMARLILVGDLGKWFLQVLISFYILVMGYPIMEDILIRKDKGRIPPSITIFSASVTLPLIFLPLGSRF